MEEAAAVRRAASEATADVVPEELRETIEKYVDDGSFVPGVLTILSARSVAGEDPDHLVRRAAGVQLIYDGLRLTRRLAHDNPWGERDVERDRLDDANVAIIAADVLVARGFYLLARTEAADEAVAVVRAFGRDQTDRETAPAERIAELDSNLEADVLELAIIAGVAAGGENVDGVTDLASDLAPEEPHFDPVGSFFDDGRRERLASLTIDSGQPLNRND